MSVSPTMPAKGTRTATHLVPLKLKHEAMPRCIVHDAIFVCRAQRRASCIRLVEFAFLRGALRRHGCERARLVCSCSSLGRLATTTRKRGTARGWLKFTRNAASDTFNYTVNVSCRSSPLAERPGCSAEHAPFLCEQKVNY